MSFIYFFIIIIGIIIYVETSKFLLPLFELILLILALTFSIINNLKYQMLNSMPCVGTVEVPPCLYSFSYFDHSFYFFNANSRIIFIIRYIHHIRFSRIIIMIVVLEWNNKLLFILLDIVSLMVSINTKTLVFIYIK